MFDICNGHLVRHSHPWPPRASAPLRHLNPTVTGGNWSVRCQRSCPLQVARGQRQPGWRGAGIHSGSGSPRGQPRPLRHRVLPHASSPVQILSALRRQRRSTPSVQPPSQKHYVRQPLPGLAFLLVVGPHIVEINPCGKVGRHGGVLQVRQTTVLPQPAALGTLARRCLPPGFNGFPHQANDLLHLQQLLDPSTHGHLEQHKSLPPQCIAQDSLETEIDLKRVNRRGPPPPERAPLLCHFHHASLRV
mmetsp:Transcript_45319/g.119687  ORF Transcript_45319/g.119687 Transcript_45319/m.119687 type:complete len:247 (-) Transcript_45319:165-905(-)